MSTLAAKIMPRCASMWNKQVFLFIFSINIKNKTQKRVRLFFALPVFVVLSLIDMFDDMCILFSVLCPNASYKTSENGIQPISKLTRTISGTVFDFAWEFAFKTGPMDFVDVDVENKNELVKVKILTR